MTDGARFPCGAGAIPPVLGELEKVQRLDLSKNQFDGEFDQETMRFCGSTPSSQLQSSFAESVTSCPDHFLTPFCLALFSIYDFAPGIYFYDWYNILL